MSDTVYSMQTYVIGDESCNVSRYLVGLAVYPISGNMAYQMDEVAFPVGSVESAASSSSASLADRLGVELKLKEAAHFISAVRSAAWSPSSLDSPILCNEIKTLLERLDQRLMSVHQPDHASTAICPCGCQRPKTREVARVFTRVQETGRELIVGSAGDEMVMKTFERKSEQGEDWWLCWA